MKKAMKQSTLTRLMNLGTIFLMVISMFIAILTTIANNVINQANTNRFDLTLNANRFMDGSAYLTSEVRAFAATGNQMHYDNYWNEVNNLKNRDIGVENMQNIGITQNEQSMIDQMSALSNNLVPLESQAMDLAKSGNRQAAIDAVFGDSYEATTGQIRALKTQFLDTLNVRTASEIETIEKRLVTLQIALLTALILVGVAQIFSMYVIHNKLLVPVNRIKDQMIKISEGNLSVPLDLEENTSEIGQLTHSIQQTKKTLHQYIRDISSKLSEMAQGNMTVQVDAVYVGEFAPIKDAMQTILSSLNHALSQINLAAQQVSSGSEMVSNDAQSLAQGATEQSASVADLSQSIAAISEKVEVNAEHSQQAEKIAVEVSEAISKSNGQMKELMQSISQINEHSVEIGKIVKTIEDISLQTNMLALNASVEAARAGAAGKGFSVVAEEVRNLANRSAEAAANTTTLIESSVRSVDNGTRIARETAQDLEEVVRKSQNSAEVIRKVTHASQEQAESIRTFLDGVEQISSVIQNNSATSEQSAAAAEELSSQADLVRQMIQKFKISNR